MGVFVGDDDELTGKSWENPTGFFERRDARKICDTLLHASGADWWKVSGFAAENANFDAVQSQRPGINALISRLDEQGTWALKEPRLCLLLPIFRSALARPLAIVTTRHPVEVARSLRRRNGFPIQAGLALWEAYTVAMLRAAVGMEHIFVRFHDLIADPHEFMERLAEDLRARRIVGLNPGKAADSIQVNLRREHHDAAADGSLLSPAQAELWEKLQGGDRDLQELPTLSASALAVLREFEADEALRRDARASIALLEKRLAEAEASHQQDVRQLRAAVEAAESRWQELHRESAARAEKLAEAQVFAHEMQRLREENAVIVERNTASIRTVSETMTRPHR